ncbi:MAG: glycerophosphodiester phosphodiesterase [Caldilineaceae bacterium]|nr:glycerophosphodiester phosphodiesterase [Caldilineaceae bacterium]
MLPILVPPSFRIIAHRGASAYVPENTLAAFELAHAMGVTEIETDVQITTDGMVVLCHDRTLARYGHGEQVVEEQLWSTLATLDMGSWFSPYLHQDKRMLRLDELFAAFGDKFTYHIELKGSAATATLAAATQQLIVQYGLHDSCIITSFAYAALVAMQQVDPSLRLGWLVQTITTEEVAKAQALGLFQLCPKAELVTPAIVAQARTVVAEVRAWGLTGEKASTQTKEVQALIQQVLAAGCDGMTINWPDWVLHDPGAEMA